MADRDKLAARIAWMVMGTGPPAIAIGVWRDSVEKNLVGIIVSLCIYAAVVVFAGEIVGELWKRWRERIIDSIDLALRRHFARFDRRYRKFVLGNLRFIDLKGLATVSPCTPRLSEVFVDVSLAPCAPNDLQMGVLADLPEKITDRHSIGDFLDRAESTVLAVVGVPGSGKTTLLRHTAWQICNARRERRRTVPILLLLRDHVGKIVKNPNISLPELLRDMLGRHREYEPAGWFEQRLHAGNCVVLLDGLDEVVGHEDRRNVADWIERQIGQYPQNDYVITSRPQGYSTANIHGATVLQVCRLTDDQVALFVRSWYLAVERCSTGEMSEEVRSQAESEADDLLNRLNDAPGLNDLTVNPLLLTMIATVHRYGSALPGSRVLLYGEICQVMLWRRQETKNIPAKLDGNKKERLLRGLAFAMMQQRVWDLPGDEVLNEIRSGLRRMPQGFNAEDFLADIRCSGLLIERESNLYSFAHHTFQEYLAATYIRDKGFHQVLADAVDDTWWQETTLLYAARSDADPIVQACLESASVTALSLAFGCADQNSELAPELRDRLDALLASASEPDTDPERRRLMAVLVTRHLRHPIRTEWGGRVCPRPITTRLYRLYQQDTHVPAPDGPLLSEQERDQPVIGVRGGDAVAFARWVNVLTHPNTAYRLPDLREINDSVVQRVLTPNPGMQSWCVWIKPEDGNGQPQLWIPDGASHPHAVNATTLAEHVKADFKNSIAKLRDLLLLRSIAAIHVLAGVLERPFDVHRDHARELARDLDLALASVCDGALASVCDSARALAQGLARDSAPARDLARLVGHTVDFGGALKLAHGLARAPDLEFALKLAHALDLDRPLDLDRTLARVTGGALSQSLIRTFPWRTANTWPTDFSQAFINETRISHTEYLVPPDSLENKVHNGLGSLLEIVESSDSDVLSHPWAYQVVRTFNETSLPILNRQHPLTLKAVTTLRITALCLAVEADIRDAHLVGDTFREIAAGVTLLERRANHATVPTETIILAAT